MLPLSTQLNTAAHNTGLIAVALAVAFFSLTSVVAPDTASAKYCADDFITATSKPHTSRSIQAVPGSLIAWKRAAAATHDSRWNTWIRAEDKSVDCHQLRSGEDEGKWVCTRAARPCAGPLGKETAARQCEPEVTSYGARRDNRRAAREQARMGWRLAARENHGETFAWEHAVSRDVECFKVDGQHQCIATAKPCNEI